jgi:hypothetical protein
MTYLEKLKALPVESTATARIALKKREGAMMVLFPF